MNFNGSRASNSNNNNPNLTPLHITPRGTAPTTCVVHTTTTNNNDSIFSGITSYGPTSGIPGGGGGVGVQPREPCSPSSPVYKYVYDLPFFDRKEFCRVFDENNQWETLGGGLMGYSSSELSEFGRAVFRNASPTDALLTAWGSQNHTILELFTLCGRLSHFRGMKLLARFVDPKYHAYIRDPNVNVTAELVQIVETPSPNVSPVADIKVQNNSPDKPSSNENSDAAKQKLVEEETKAKLSESAGLLPHVPFSEIVIATNKWDRRNILGKGGFGTVFKGVWKNTSVAIKRMETRTTPIPIQTQRKQSLEELKFLNSYRHDNILPLYGYCMEDDHPLCLVYQFMPNGSLEDRLLCRQKTMPLSWSMRFNITRGVACGIQFLHSIGPKPLIHGDIKSANILLDRNFEAKVGDFGLAREMNANSTDQAGGASYVKVSRVHGTRPYLPDEYLRSKKLSIKVDTFSFGIMLLEIITGQRAYEDSRQKKFLKDMFEEVENVEMLKDPRGGHDNPDIFWIFIKLAKMCTQRLAKERPDMVQVLKTLDGLMTQATSIRTISSQVTGLPLLFETRPASLMPIGTSTNHRLSPVEVRTPSPHWTPAASHQQLHQQFYHQSPKYPLLDSAASVRRSPIPTATSSTSSAQPHPQPREFMPTQSPQFTPPTTRNKMFQAQPQQQQPFNIMPAAVFSANQPNNVNNPFSIPPLQPVSSLPVAPVVQQQIVADEEAIPTTITQNSTQSSRSSRSDSDKHQQTIAVAPFIPVSSPAAEEVPPAPLPMAPAPPVKEANQDAEGVGQSPNAHIAPIEVIDDFIPLMLLSASSKKSDMSEKDHDHDHEEPEGSDPTTVIPLITELGIKD